MPQLELNIPITFDAAAALDINTNITQRVSNAEGRMTNFEQSAEGFNMFTSYLGEQKSGLTITNNDITLSANKTYIKTPGSNAATLFENGKIKTDYISADAIEAKTLKTINGTGEVDIREGVITCSGQNGETKIKFGIDGNGNAILDFIINTGNEDNVIYSLGPTGLIQLDFNVFANKFESLDLTQCVTNKIFMQPSSNLSLYLPMMFSSGLNYDSNINSSWCDCMISLDPENGYNSVFTHILNNDTDTDARTASYVSFKNEKLWAISTNMLINNTITYYKFIAGYKYIVLPGAGQQNKYHDTGTSQIPSYNNYIYQSNTDTIEYKTSSSNYIPDGYYITIGSIGLTPPNYDKFTKFAPIINDCNNVTHNAYDEENYKCGIISIDESTNGHTITYEFGLIDNTTKYCEIYIHKYYNGQYVAKYKCYGIFAYNSGMLGTTELFRTSSIINYYMPRLDMSNSYIIPVIEYNGDPGAGSGEEWYGYKIITPDNTSITNSNINSFIEKIINEGNLQNLI